MNKQYQYDVAISFAEEDIAIATELADEMTALGLKVYNYKNFSAQNWGKDLMDVVVEVYKYQARYALVLVSESYLKKKWTKIERQIIQGVKRDAKAYLLPLRLDDSELPDVSDHTIYEMYNDNAQEIALQCKTKMEERIPLDNQPFLAHKKRIKKYIKKSNKVLNNYIKTNKGGIQIKM